MEAEEVFEGRSTSSFAEAAYNAIAKAEDVLGEDAPTVFDITLRATRERGQSLSEYIALARGSG